MHTQRLVVLVLALLGMLCTFLPWATVPLMGSVSGTAGDGWITFGIFFIALVMTLLGDRKAALIKAPLVVTLIMGILAAVIAIYKIIDFKSALKSATGEDELSQAIGSMVSIGIGLYLIAIAGVAIVVFCFILKGKKQAAAASTP